jgi:outer membrane receptor protein involved in Fe transport
MRKTGCLGAVALLLSCSVAATAQPSSRQYRFDIQSVQLSEALRRVAIETGADLIAPADLVQGRNAPPLRGTFTADAAIDALLQGSGLTFTRAKGAILISRVGSEDANLGKSAGKEDAVQIVVTGTRIRGAAPVGSTVTTIDRTDMARSGYVTTQDILQTIPQNFGGAPNEGTVAISLDPNSGKNTGNGSSINLRGLGNQSTLVLLNGDRPPLGGFAGVFSDVSLIPASAIERIEVLADGTSAIYGSDAVAGVVNVVPRLRFEGAETSFRVGTADGDSQDLLASQIVGKGWRSGHAVVAYEFYWRSALPASKRAYVTDDLSQFGGPDLRGPFASPGNILAGEETFAVPPGQDGNNLSATSRSMQRC